MKTFPSALLGPNPSIERTAKGYALRLPLMSNVSRSCLRRAAAASCTVACWAIRWHRSAWAVRPLAAGAPAVVREKANANANAKVSAGCPSFGGQRTALASVPQLLSAMAASS
jgi:hypothetical protein